MQFGITLKPDISVERIVGLTRQAEGAGFDYGWIFDSHVLWKEPYPLLTLILFAGQVVARAIILSEMVSSVPLCRHSSK